VNRQDQVREEIEQRLRDNFWKSLEGIVEDRLEHERVAWEEERSQELEDELSDQFESRLEELIDEEVEKLEIDEAA
jgi:hypothetical protein